MNCSFCDWAAKGLWHFVEPSSPLLVCCVAFERVAADLQWTMVTQRAPVGANKKQFPFESFEHCCNLGLGDNTLTF